MLHIIHGKGVIYKKKKLVVIRSKTITENKIHKSIPQLVEITIPAFKNINILFIKHNILFL